MPDKEIVFYVSDAEIAKGGTNISVWEVIEKQALNKIMAEFPNAHNIEWEKRRTADDKGTHVFISFNV